MNKAYGHATFVFVFLSIATAAAAATTVWTGDAMSKLVVQRASVTTACVKAGADENAVVHFIDRLNAEKQFINDHFVLSSIQHTKDYVAAEKTNDLSKIEAVIIAERKKIRFRLICDKGSLHLRMKNSDGLDTPSDPTL